MPELRIFAVPIGKPMIYVADIIANGIWANVAEDGSFSIGLAQETNYVLLLIDASRPKYEQVLGYVALGDAIDNMVLMPTESAINDIDAGKLEMVGSEAVSNGSLAENAASFDINIYALLSIAQTDDLLCSCRKLT